MTEVQAHGGRAHRAAAHAAAAHGDGRQPPPPKGGGDREPPFIARLEGVPLELVLTTFRGRVRIEVDETSELPVLEASFRVDGGAWQALERTGRRLRGHFDADALEPGAHLIELRAMLVDGTERVTAATFRVRQGAL